MGYVAMAIPATNIVFLLEIVEIMISVAVFPDHPHNPCMAGDTVGLDPVSAVFADVHALTEGVEGESSGMVPAISGFRQVFAEKTVGWQVAFDTSDLPGMGTVLPSGILGVHYMAVNAGLGVMRQVG